MSDHTIRTPLIPPVSSDLRPLASSPVVIDVDESPRAVVDQSVRAALRSELSGSPRWSTSAHGAREARGEGFLGADPARVGMMDRSLAAPRNDLLDVRAAYDYFAGDEDVFALSVSEAARLISAVRFEPWRTMIEVPTEMSRGEAEHIAKKVVRLCSGLTSAENERIWREVLRDEQVRLTLPNYQLLRTGNIARMSPMTGHLTQLIDTASRPTDSTVLATSVAAGDAAALALLAENWTQNGLSARQRFNCLWRATNATHTFVQALLEQQAFSCEQTGALLRALLGPEKPPGSDLASPDTTYTVEQLNALFSSFDASKTNIGRYQSAPTLFTTALDDLVVDPRHDCFVFPEGRQPWLRRLTVLRALWDTYGAEPPDGRTRLSERQELAVAALFLPDNNADILAAYTATRVWGVRDLKASAFFLQPGGNAAFRLVTRVLSERDAALLDRIGLICAHGQNIASPYLVPASDGLSLLRVTAQDAQAVDLIEHYLSIVAENTAALTMQGLTRVVSALQHLMHHRFLGINWRRRRAWRDLIKAAPRLIDAFDRTVSQLKRARLARRRR